MKVIKFGGSSLADATQIAKTLAIVKVDPDRQIMVVSAPGKRFDGDTKVTDLFLQYAQAVIDNRPTATLQEEISARYQQIATAFDLDDAVISSIHDQILALEKRHFPSFDHLRAAFAAHGELLNAQLIAAVFTAQGLPARFVSPKDAGLLVQGAPRNAQLVPESYLTLAKNLQPNGEVLIFPGFFGFTKDGWISTFSRGGSDISGAIVARALQADLYENFTDVDAIYAAHPGIVADPKAITQLTYKEMRELAYAGFAVFHDEAIIPAIEGNVTINVKNTNNPEQPGTLIVPEDVHQPDSIITGIAHSNRFAALYLHRYLLNREVGFTRRLLNIFYEHNISYEHMPSGIDDLTVIFDKDQLQDVVIADLLTEIQAELQPDTLEWLDDYTIIMVVGEGMRKRADVLGKIIGPLSDQNIPIQMVNQGASQISVMLGIQTKDTKRAVQAIYQNFF
ncbi:MAG TPA: aspartate kinase [Lactobacillaceae bacterium]|jgi:aspartate kinase